VEQATSPMRWIRKKDLWRV